MSAPTDDPHPATPTGRHPHLDNEPPPLLERRDGGLRIADVPAWYFLALFATLAVAAVTDTLPDTMIAGFAVTLVLGGLLFAVGDAVPVLRDFGLPTILCTFVPATLVAVGIMPGSVVELTKAFVDDWGFLDFFVIAVICGTILGMPRALLLKAGPRFAVPIIGCLAATFAIVGLVGAISGYGFAEAILMVAAPIMAGGLGIGAVPMSQMYAEHTGATADSFMADLMSAVVFANIICILVAGFYNGLGKRGVQLFAGFDGHGQLLRVRGRHDDLVMPKKRTAADYLSLGKGLAISGCLLVLGTMLGTAFPVLHPYAWTIIAAASVKIFKLFPSELEEASAEWGDMMTTVLVPALLVGVSLTFIDMADVLASVSNPRFILLSAVTVLVATLTSGILGWPRAVPFHRGGDHAGARHGRHGRQRRCLGPLGSGTDAPHALRGADQPHRWSPGPLRDLPAHPAPLRAAVRLPATAERPGHVADTHLVGAAGRCE